MGEGAKDGGMLKESRKKVSKDQFPKKESFASSLKISFA